MKNAFLSLFYETITLTIIQLSRILLWKRRRAGKRLSRPHLVFFHQQKNKNKKRGERQTQLDF